MAVLRVPIYVLNGLAVGNRAAQPLLALETIEPRLERVGSVLAVKVAGLR
jgi:hypothetical protein